MKIKRRTTTLREIGGLLRGHIGVLLQRVYERIQKDEQNFQTLRTDLYTPFITPAEVAAVQQFTPDGNN